MDQSKQSITGNNKADEDRKSSDWVEQAKPLHTANQNDHQLQQLESAEENEQSYDSTSEEIIATHDSRTQEEGVDEEWSGGGAENKDFTTDSDDELA